MKPELKEKLEQAGFPMTRHAEPEDTVPLLEDLIKACGSNFVGLRFTELKTFNLNSTRPLGSRMGWVAMGHKRPDNRVNIGSGNSPSEAVAKLWLMIKEEFDERIARS